MQLLVTEKTGQQLGTIANYMDPEKEPFCRRDGCFLCKTSDGPTWGKCWREGVTYQITCLVCLREGRQAVYLGETGYSSYFRGRFHQDGLRNKIADNPLYKHCLECHPAGRMDWRDFKMSVVGQFPRPILRQSHERQLIERAVDQRAGGEGIIILNSKSEFL